MNDQLPAPPKPRPLHAAFDAIQLERGSTSKAVRAEHALARDAVELLERIADNAHTMERYLTRDRLRAFARDLEAESVIAIRAADREDHHDQGRNRGADSSASSSRDR